MSGFFSSEEIPLNTQMTKVSCSRCGLHLSCNTPKFEPTGNNNKKIYILGDHPSQADDDKGLHFSGDSGKFLSGLLKKLKVDLRNDCVCDFAVRCCPSKGKIDKMNIEACRNKVWDDIRQYQPKLILIFGSDALETFLKPRWPSTVGEIGTWRGFVIPDREVNAWVAPMYHPKFITQNMKKHPVLKKMMLDDLRYALSHLNIDVPQYVDERKQIKLINDEAGQIAWFKELYEQALVQDLILALDYETTGLKPHAEGHAIACVSFCYKEDEAVSMWVPSMTPLVHRWMKKILTCPKIHKVAHNLKYEMSWTEVKLGYKLFPASYCSMLSSHIIDNRPGIVGLKFQSYVRFGLMSYEEHIKPFLESGGGGNSFNNVFKAPKIELQIYNGIDSLVQYRLVMQQCRETGYNAIYPITEQ